MTVEHILPFFVELIPWIKAEVADSSGEESTGVSVGMDASFVSFTHCLLLICS
jgi:hypothetical protein